MSTLLPLVVLDAPAKLTVSLRITGIRADGYHLLDAEMVSLDLADRVELLLDPPSAVGSIELTMVDAASGQAMTPVAGDNLVARALGLAGRTGRATVIKAIPPGAGLGGGSSDAAAVLAWAGIDDPTRSVAIGADVPFCVRGGRARVGGIGEVVDPLPFRPQTFTLLTPPFGCSTPAVYRRWDELGGPRDQRPGPVNDLEVAACSVEPRLVEWRDRLAEATGLAPRLAGSGSTWFVEGAFPGDGRVVTHALGPRG
jgi:4-diphosphocytidyl-2-C-methyl-D-erythritol kinase